MTLDQLDVRLRALGWTRVSRLSWSCPPRLITLTQGRAADPWELKTITGIDPIKREYFPDARSIHQAVTA